MTQQLTTKRDPSIYILKCLAVMLVVWSHCDKVMPLAGMATGGALGDGLFLFCSGFTLFLGRGGGVQLVQAPHQSHLPLGVCMGNNSLPVV